MKKIYKNLLLFGLLGFLCACSASCSKKSDNTPVKPDDPVKPEPEDIDDGRELIENHLYTDSGFDFLFQERGARIAKVTYNGTEIAKDGFVAGRCANRIAGASFELNGETYNVDKNDGNNHLHGGKMGFGEVTWTKKEQTPSSITFTYHSPDGEMGYPGNLDIEVKYTLKNNGELMMEYKAKSDADTIINPTNHIWLSLNGKRSSLNHTLWIDADNYTPRSKDLIPTGEIASVEDTIYDFREEETEFIPSNRYDDNWVLNGTGFRKVCTLTGEMSGVKVDISTDRPGLQMYNDQSHIVLETQLYPDAIHHADWPSPILRANTDFYTKSVYAFSDIYAEE